MLDSYIATQIYAKIGLEPTIGQKKIVEKLSRYLAEPSDGGIFILNGYAGTGKTTLVAALVGALKGLGVKTVLLAPTGRAAKVSARYAGQSAYTIHKYIYRERTSADYASHFSLAPNRDRGVVFIVDEASMLTNTPSPGSLFGSGDLLDDLVRFVAAAPGCRLILVGDSAQLPPVGEALSPALDAERMSRYGTIVATTLREVVRQAADSGILRGATLLRTMLEEARPALPRFPRALPDLRFLEGGEFMEEVESCYGRYGRDETIVLCRSNRRANRFNEGIRRYVLGAEEEIEAGDMLMVVKNNYHYANAEAGLDFLANGDLARLRRIRHHEELYGLRFAECTLEMVDYDTQVECRILLDTLSTEAPALTREQNEALLRGVEADYADIPSGRKRWQKIREDEHFNAVQVKFAYAVTCHKAQGGQWKAVFVDRMLFGEEEMTVEWARWLYTALTRATERVYLVHFGERFMEDG